MLRLAFSIYLWSTEGIFFSMWSLAVVISSTLVTKAIWNYAGWPNFSPSTSLFNPQSIVTSICLSRKPAQSLTKKEGKKKVDIWRIHKYIALYPLMPLISEVQCHKAWISAQGFWRLCISVGTKWDFVMFDTKHQTVF